MLHISPAHKVVSVNFSIKSEHCTIDHDGSTNVINVIPAAEAKIKVNGVSLVEKRELRHGDR